MKRFNYKNNTILSLFILGAQQLSATDKHPPIAKELDLSIPEKEAFGELKAQSEIERFKNKLYSIFDCPQDIKNPAEESSTKFWYLNRLMTEQAKVLQEMKKEDPQGYAQKAAAFNTSISKAFDDLMRNNVDLSKEELLALKRIQELISTSNSSLTSVLNSDNPPTQASFKTLIGMIPAEENPWIRNPKKESLDWGDFEALSSNKIYQNLYDKLGAKCLVAIKDQKKNPKAFANYIKNREKAGVLLSENEKKELGHKVSMIGRLSDYMTAKDDNSKQKLFNSFTENGKYANFFNAEIAGLKELKEKSPATFSTLNQLYLDRGSKKEGDILDDYLKIQQDSRLELREIAMVTMANFKQHSSDASSLKVENLLPSTDHEKLARLMADAGLLNKSNSSEELKDFDLEFAKQLYVLQHTKPKNSTDLAAYLNMMGTSKFLKEHQDSPQAQLLLSYYNLEYSKPDVSKATRSRLIALGILTKAPTPNLVKGDEKGSKKSGD